jgi:hypothetical protein
MPWRTIFVTSGILFSQFDLVSSQTRIRSLQQHNIRTVASETLTDLAVAFADSSDPVVYYNPRLMARYGTEISAFVLAHEYGHIQLGHRRPSAASAGARDAIEQLLQGWELDADCFAAARLARERPSALLAAIGFFERMGLDRVDREHPTGSARAAQLTACGRTVNGDLRSSSEGPRIAATAIQFR